MARKIVGVTRPRSNAPRALESVVKHIRITALLATRLQRRMLWRRRPDKAELRTSIGKVVDWAATIVVGRGDFMQRNVSVWHDY